MEEALQLIPGTVVRRQHPDFNLNFKREKMKKVNLLLWPLLFSAVCILSSCKDTEDKSNAVPVKGDNITFSATTQTTRTTVDPNDPLQLDWTEGDKVRIACDQSEAAKVSDYSVTVSGSRNAGDLTSVSMDPSGWLMWSGDNNLYKFYAAYPADDSKVKINSSTGVATFTLNQNQECTISGNAVNNQFTATPEPDKNAYMVANNNTYPTKKPISLDFKPIMTTINFTVNGPAEANQKMRLTGLAIIFSSKDVKASEPYDQTVKFDYDINKGEMVSGSGDEETNTVLVNVKQGDNHYIDLSSGQSVKLTAYLPPFAVNENNKIKVRVLGSYGINKTYNDDPTASAVSMVDAQKSIAFNIPAGSNANITLPTIKFSNSNNWITPLDDNILVSQLSIPGTYDSMANWNAMTSNKGKDFGVTQSFTLKKQWEMGVRCFDLGVAIWDNDLDDTNDKDESLKNYGEKPLWIYAGLLRTWDGWSNWPKTSTQDINNDGHSVGAIDQIHQKLKENPGEFAIVILSHKNNDSFGMSSHKNNDPVLFNQKMTEWMNAHRDWVVEWNPYLTIGDCRGKIVLFTRDPNRLDKKADQNIKWSWHVGAFINNDGPGVKTGWPDNDEDIRDQAVDITKSGPLTPNIRSDQYTGQLVMQDYFYSSSWDEGGYKDKWNNIKYLLDLTTTQLNNSDKQYYLFWAINFTTWWYYHFPVDRPSTQIYAEGAAHQNLSVIDYLKTHVGPTGIIMSAQMGARIGYYEWGLIIPTYPEVDGDLLLQSIINNNYRYTMVRKK